MSVENVTKKMWFMFYMAEKISRVYTIRYICQIMNKIEIYDDERGLKWKWQSLVSISIKYSFGRRIHVKIVPIDTT